MGHRMRGVQCRFYGGEIHRITISLHSFSKFIEQIEAVNPFPPNILAQRIVLLLSGVKPFFGHRFAETMIGLRARLGLSNALSTSKIDKPPATSA